MVDLDGPSGGRCTTRGACRKRTCSMPPPAPGRRPGTRRVERSRSRPTTRSGSARSGA